MLVMSVNILFSFSSKQNGYSANDQVNVMKLRLTWLEIQRLKTNKLKKNNVVFIQCI